MDDKVKRMKEEYPIGTRVKLVKMNDPYPVPVGTLGTVVGTDDIASLLMRWDNGSSLNVLFDEDKVVKVKKCPKCNKEYSEVSATSRIDNSEICPSCGVVESLQLIGMPEDEINKILEKIREVENGLW